MSGRRAALIALAGGLLAAAPARAEPAPPAGPAVCDDALADPVTTPVRVPAVDAQRTACLRHEGALVLHADALIDTPGFRGVLGGDLRALARIRIGRRAELDVGVRGARGVFVQNAVTKVTTWQLGPVLVGGAWGTALGDGPDAPAVAIAGLLELPYSRDDVATLHASGDLSALLTAPLSPRTTLHARLGVVAAYAASGGGATHQVAARAGADLARRVGRALALHGGVEIAAGWYGRGLDHALVRAGVAGRLRGGWRLAGGIGVPVAGAERTTAVVDVGLVRALR